MGPGDTSTASMSLPEEHSMTMDISTFVFASATAAAWMSALAALWRARTARRDARAAHGAATTMAQRIDALEQALAERMAHIEAQLAESSHAVHARSRPGLREAVALSRHGASTDELVSTCRIGRSEAHLIQLLYGAARDATTPPTATDIH